MKFLKPADPAVLRVSVSQIRAFQMCPKRYQFRYVMGAEPEHRSANLVLGGAVHAALASYYGAIRAGKSPVASTVLEHYNDSLTDGMAGAPPVKYDDGESELDVRAGGEALIRAFLADVAPPHTVLAVEEAVHADIVDPDTGEIVEEQLVAYMDAVVEVDGKVAVLEHKTVARAWSRDQLEFDLQVSLYQALTDAEAVRLQVLTKTKAPKFLTYELRRTDREMIEAVTIVCRVLDAIRAGAFWPNPGWACRECEYRRQCRG